MSTRNDGGPAFPRFGDQILDAGSMQPSIIHYGGMSLRDYFAAAALQGLASDCTGITERAAVICYQFADAMLAERAK